MSESKRISSSVRDTAGRDRIRAAVILVVLSLSAAAASFASTDTPIDAAEQTSNGAARPTSKLGVDVVFVLDNSGSMRHNDPEFLTRRAVANFAEALAAEPALKGRIAIVLFDGRARLVQPLTRIEKGNARAVLDASLATLDFAGQRTNSPSGIERALYELRQNGREDAHRAIVLLTDGKIDTGSRADDLEAGRWLREDLAGESQAEGIRIFGVAFTDAADYQLMQALALKTEGSYYRAFEAAELQSVVADVLAQIENPYAHSLASAGSSETAALAGSSDIDPGSDAPPAVGSAPIPDVDEDRFELFGWLPIALFLAAGSLLWRYSRRDVPVVPPSPTAPFVDVDPVAPKAQLLDFGGRIGEVGGVLTLGEGRTTIGRDPHNDIVLENDAISSEHALIEVRRGRHWIEDRRSTNGTFLGDQPLSPGQAAQLKGGDKIRFGELELMFALPGYQPAGATAFLNPSTTVPPGWSPTSTSTFGAGAGAGSSKATENTPSNGGKSNPHLAEATGPDRPHISLLPSPRPEMSAPEKGTERKDEVTIDVPDESVDFTEANIYRQCLDYHLERVQEISTALASFVERGFDLEMRDALSVAADELIAEAQTSDSIQQKAYTASGIRYLICAVPDSMEHTRERFGKIYGGFTRLLTGALQDESFVRDRCEILVVLTFGRENDAETETPEAPWVSLSIVPDEGQDPCIDLLSYEFLTDAERKEIEAGESADSSQSSQA